MLAERETSTNSHRHHQQQPNIWDESRPFHSFKKVACDLGLGDDPNMQLASMHSVSKGFLGEYVRCCCCSLHCTASAGDADGASMLGSPHYNRCGHRGGYMEVLNFEAEVRAELYKLASLSLCSNVAGQVMVSCVPFGCWRGAATSHPAQLLRLVRSS